MLPLLFCTLLLATSIQAHCTITALKHHGEPCVCSDRCLDNSVCQRDGQGGTRCLCLPCERFDIQLGQCVTASGFGDVCQDDDDCLPELTCTIGVAGKRTCRCKPNQFFNYEQQSCVPLPGYLQPCQGSCQSNLMCLPHGSGSEFKCQCSQGGVFDKQQGRCQFNCINDTNQGCQGKANGDYALCFPQCQQGQFMTCSNNIPSLRDCALGWYVLPNGYRFTYKMVFDPAYRRCERGAGYCPRKLDNYIEG